MENNNEAEAGLYRWNLMISAFFVALSFFRSVSENKVALTVVKRYLRLSIPVFAASLIIFATADNRVTAVRIIFAVTLLVVIVVSALMTYLFDRKVNKFTGIVLRKWEKE